VGVIETTKEAISLIQKFDNIELMRMLNLQTQVVALEEENRALKQKLATKERLVFRKNAYWMGDEGPFCSRCWDTDAKLVRLHRHGEFHPAFPSCSSVAVDPDHTPPSAVRRQGYRSRGGY
jgi:hypothetical protein